MVPEISFRAYRHYIDDRVEVNNAMMALLAGSRLAAEALRPLSGSGATLGELFPGVEHIERFNLRSEPARTLLCQADHHIASVAIPYALATHEEFVVQMNELLKSEGVTLITQGKPIKAWNMHEVLFASCSFALPSEWMQIFHVLRELRNAIIHGGGVVTSQLNTSIAVLEARARGRWAQMNLGQEPEALDDGTGRLALTPETVFTAFAATKRLGREINAALGSCLGSATWARMAVEDFAASTDKTRNSSSWRRSPVGYARHNYAAASLSAEDLERAASETGVWTVDRW